MKEQFCTYEIAKALKELRFDEPCFTYWFTVKGGEPQLRAKDIYFDGYRNNPEGNTAAPLWQQAIDWLREKKKIAVCQAIKGEWYASPILPGLGLNETKHFTKSGTREAAILKAIEIIRKEQAA